MSTAIETVHELSCRSFDFEAEIPAAFCRPARLYPRPIPSFSMLHAEKWGMESWEWAWDETKIIHVQMVADHHAVSIKKSLVAVHPKFNFTMQYLLRIFVKTQPSLAKKLPHTLALSDGCDILLQIVVFDM